MGYGRVENRPNQTYNARLAWWRVRGDASTANRLNELHACDGCGLGPPREGRDDDDVYFSDSGALVEFSQTFALANFQTTDAS